MLSNGYWIKVKCRAHLRYDIYYMSIQTAMSNVYVLEMSGDDTFIDGQGSAPQESVALKCKRQLLSQNKNLDNLFFFLIFKKEKRNDFFSNIPSPSISVLFLTHSYHLNIPSKINEDLQLSQKKESNMVQVYLDIGNLRYW